MKTEMTNSNEAFAALLNKGYVEYRKDELHDGSTITWLIKARGKHTVLFWDAPADSMVAGDYGAWKQMSIKA